ncbi:MAG: DUF3006 domain-containing protein [Clostridia bacterium]|nr:DUF3006 domain-containing protein [Clostridia bacterium]
MIFSVDRIKDGALICEDIKNGNLHVIKPQEKIAGIKEGSIIEINGDKIELKEEIYLERKEKILNLKNRLCENNDVKK